MSAEKKYTERDIILARRQGAAWMRCAQRHALDWDEPGDGPCDDCVKRAREVYPLPTITRPRVHKDHRGVEWRVVGGKIQRNCSSGWTDIDEPPDFAVAIASLVANPTETVEDKS